jgi:hypothetical protein
MDQDDEIDIPLYADYDIDRIAWALQTIRNVYGVGAPTLTDSINDFASAHGLLKNREALNTKNIQRALKAQRQIDSTTRILDRYVAAARPLSRHARLGEALAEYWASERLGKDDGLFKGPASFFTREFVGSYTCAHKRWLSPEDAAAADADPDHFNNAEGDLRVGGVAEPQEGYREVWFPVANIHFRPTAGYGSIEMTETVSPYLDYDKSPGYNPEPMVWEGTLAATDAKDRYFGIVSAGGGRTKLYRLQRGALDEASGFHEFTGVVIGHSRVDHVRLIPGAGQQPLGDYFPDELLSESKKEWLHFTKDKPDPSGAD